MEDLLLKSNGLAGMLASIAAITGMHLLAKMGEFLWRLREKKDRLTESSMAGLSEAVRLNTIATERLDGRIKSIETTLGGAAKFRIDMRRLYAAVKILSGDKWDGIKKRVIEEERPLD